MLFVILHTNKTQGVFIPYISEIDAHIAFHTQYVERYHLERRLQAAFANDNGGA